MAKSKTGTKMSCSTPMSKKVEGKGKGKEGMLPGDMPFKKNAMAKAKKKI
jgi:hypothetical protein